jgi:hypothetical protein
VVIAVLTLAPTALVLLVALLRGYTITLHMQRVRKRDQGDES